MKNIEKILVAGALAGLITLGVGAAIDNKLVSYIGTGAVIVAVVTDVLYSPLLYTRNRGSKDKNHTHYNSPTGKDLDDYSG
jgi:hypothetical protein